jgi:hypothetical protein
MKSSSVVALLPVLGVAFLFSCTPVVTHDIFWHLKTGLLVLEEQSLLHTNTFSSIFPDHPWPNPEWLFQVTVAMFYRVGGWEAVTVMKVSLVMALAVALFLSVRFSGGRPLLAAALTLVTLSAIRFRFIERPHLFSYLFILAAMFIAERCRHRGGKAVWLLPPLFALWSNIHPELIIAFLSMAAVIAGDAINALRRPSAERPSPAFAAAVILCIPAACLNPEGYHVLAFPFLHTFIGPIVEVTEYALSMPSRQPLFWLFTLALIAVFLKDRRPVDWGELLPVAGVALLGALYLRATPYVFLLGAPVLCRHLSRSGPGRSPWTLRQVNCAAVVVAALSLTWAVSFDRLSPYRWGWGVDESKFPVAAANLLSTGRLPGRLYNDYSSGSYLIYRLPPEVGVFQDGRLQAYPAEFMAQFNSQFSQEEWPGLLKKYGVNTALVKLPALNTLFSSDEWGMVFWDDRRAILVRRGGSRDELLRRLEYRLFTPGADLDSYHRQSLPHLIAEMERNQGERFEESPLLRRDLEETRKRLREVRGP